MTNKERLLVERHDLESLVGKREGLCEEAGVLHKRSEALGKVNLYLNGIVEQSITENKRFIEGLVNQCLEYVFGRYAIEVCEKTHGARVIRYIEIVDTVSKVSGGKETHGGGVLAVISFLFKFIISFKFRFYPLLVLDETFSFVSKEYRGKLSFFIKQLCEKFGYTVILISHEPEMVEYADKAIVFYKEGDTTKVKEN